VFATEAMQLILVFAIVSLIVKFTFWLAWPPDPPAPSKCVFCKNDLPVILAYDEDVNWNIVCTKHLETRARIKKLESELLIDELVRKTEQWPGINGRFRNTNNHYITITKMPPVRHICPGDLPDELEYKIERIERDTPDRPRAIAEPETIYK
jgi:hypothetical protein